MRAYELTDYQCQDSSFLMYYKILQIDLKMILVVGSASGCLWWCGLSVVGYVPVRLHVYARLDLFGTVAKIGRYYCCSI